MQTNFILPETPFPYSGIGRYVEELRAALTDLGVTTHTAPFRYPPGVARFPFLLALPIGAQPDRAPGVDHLPQIIGASMLLRPRRRPTVATVHDLGTLYCPEDRALTNPIDRALFAVAWRGFRRADHILADSEFTRSGAIRAGVAPERVTTVHLGVDHATFRPRAGAAAQLAARYGLDPARPIVLYVGNDLPRKNLPTLVRALGLLKRDGVPFQWLKIGAPNHDPGRAEVLRLVAEHDLGNAATILDRVPGEDLALAYAAAAVYAQPSVWEGFGLPVLEAMASGAPVVAAAAAALPEVCGDAAVLVAPRDPAAWAAALGALLGDADARQRLGRAGLAHAARFTWSAAAAKTLAVYERVLDEHAGGNARR